MEVEHLRRDYAVNVRWAPYLLDPTIPPEGKQREPQTSADTPKSHLELMAESRGLTFKRGRTLTPSTHLALEATEFAYDHGHHSDGLHRALFKANFEDFENIGDIDVLQRIASEQDIDAVALREALTDGRYRERVDEQIAWARSVGVTGIPTFIFDYKFAMAGAQQYDVFQSVMGKLGYSPKSGGDPSTPKDPGWAI